MTARFLPTCTVIAGPNGGGKSTIIAELAPPGEVVNADDYARRINPVDVRAASLPAGREVLHRLYELIRHRQSFNFETTLSGNHPIELMARARAEGYRVDLAFVVLRSPDLHLARVRTRVASGGHDIPADTILRRYDRALSNLPAAIRLADQVIIFDNTGKAPKALCRIDGRRIAFSELDDADEFHIRLADLVGAGLDLPLSSVLGAAKDRS